MKTKKVAQGKWIKEWILWKKSSPTITIPVSGFFQEVKLAAIEDQAYYLIIALTKESVCLEPIQLIQS